MNVINYAVNLDGYNAGCGFDWVINDWVEKVKINAVIEINLLNIIKITTKHITIYSILTQESSSALILAHRISNAHFVCKLNYNPVNVC